MDSVVGERGQVTIPKRLRERLGLRPGDRVEFRESPSGITLTRVRSTSPLSELVGIAKSSKRVDDLIEELRGSA